MWNNLKSVLGELSSDVPIALTKVLCLIWGPLYQPLIVGTVALPSALDVRFCSYITVLRAQLISL